MNTSEPNAKAGDLVSLCCKLIKESSVAHSLIDFI